MWQRYFIDAPSSHQAPRNYIAEFRVAYECPICVRLEPWFFVRGVERQQLEIINSENDMDVRCLLRYNGELSFRTMSATFMFSPAAGSIEVIRAPQWQTVMFDKWSEIVAEFILPPTEGKDGVAAPSSEDVPAAESGEKRKPRRERCSFLGYRVFRFALESTAMAAVWHPAWRFLILLWPGSGGWLAACSLGRLALYPIQRGTPAEAVLAAQQLVQRCVEEHCAAGLNEECATDAARRACSDAAILCSYANVNTQQQLRQIMGATQWCKTP